MSARSLKCQCDRYGHSYRKYFVTTQDAMMGGKEGTTKYAKGAKRQARLMFKDESYKQSNYLEATGKHFDA
jgi:hypothetical protein